MTLRDDAQIAIAIARKDAVAELRGRHATVSTLFFSAVVLLLFGFALGPDSARLSLAAPGLLWLAVVFAGMLAVSRLHLLETDDGALEQLALYPISRRAIYLGKALAGLAVMLVLGLLVLGAVGVLFAVDIGAAGLPLVTTVLLGAVGIAAVGTFYAGVTVRLRAREVMLPLLMLPVLAPLLLAAVKATAAALAGDPFGELGAWLQLLVAFDVIMVVAGAATYGYLLEDSMKTRILGFAALVAVAVMLVISLFVVPADLNQGDAQRIMYPHVASAWLGYLSFGVTALAGIGWLWKRDLRLDAVALAGAEIGVIFTAFAIWGGMMWGRPIWGVFWQWEDPRLTTTALLLALYVGYLLLRRLTDDPERRATRAAIVGIVAAVDIPIVHFSVEWWRGLHQTATIGSPDRVLNPAAPMAFVGTLLGMLAAFTLTWAYLMIRRYQLARAELAREEAVRRQRILEARAPHPSAAPPEVAR